MGWGKPEVFFMSRYRVHLESPAQANGVNRDFVVSQWPEMSRKFPAGELRMGPVRNFSCVGGESRAILHNPINVRRMS